MKDKKSLFAIPRLKQTLSPSGGYYVIPLESPYFHPDDSDSLTYDIAVFKVKKDLAELRMHNVYPLSFDRYSKMLLENNSKLFATGFPVDYTKEYLSRNNEEYFPPKIVSGVLRELSIKDLQQNGFVGRLQEGYFLEVTLNEVLGKGSSGGFVYSIDKFNKNVPIGLILGNANIVESLPNNQKRDIYGIVFAKIDRILEVLDSINIKPPNQRLKLTE
jgi:hypothetical protein